MTPPKPQGREDLAKEIRKIYEDSPTFSEAYRNIADFIIKRDKSRDQALEKAKRLAEHVIEIGPSEKGMYCTFCNALSAEVLEAIKSLSSPKDGA